MNDLLTAEDVAAYFSVKPTTVNRWARQGVIESVQVPGIKRRLFRRSDVEALVAPASKAAS